MSGSRIGMVVYGDIRHDSRVQREASSLADVGHDVTIYCLAGTGEPLPQLDPRVKVVARRVEEGGIAPGSPSPFRRPVSASFVGRVVRRVSWLTRYARSLRAWGRTVTANAPHIDVWHAHDLTGLVAIAGVIGRDARTVYDVHDLFVETGTGRLLPALVRRAIRRYERHLVRRVDLVVAVNRPLAEVVASRCDPRSIIVVHNCPPRWTPPEPRPDLIRQAAGIPAGAPVVLYHGLLGSYRGIEQLLEAMLLPALEGDHLALMGYGERTEQLKVTAADPRYRGRVHVLDPVLPADLLPWVASADVGAMAMPRASLNLYLSTPNKLFECLAAGTPVVVSDFPAVRDIVAGDPLGPLGATCDPADPRDVARAIAAILSVGPAERLEMRRRCNTAAHERWSWEAEVAGLTAAYARLAADGRAASSTSRR